MAWARYLLSESLKLVEKRCVDTQRADIWGVFECRILRPLFEQCDPVPYAQLAKRFNLRSAKQATLLLITAQRIFGRSLRAVIGEHAKDKQGVESGIQGLKAILFCGIDGARDATVGQGNRACLCPKSSWISPARLTRNRGRPRI